MNIRNPTEKDFAGIASLSRSFVNEIPAFGLSALTEKYLKTLDHRLIRVVEENDRLLGYAVCLPRKTDDSYIFNKNDKILAVDEIYVVPEARGKGIGSQLLQTIDSFAREQGFTKLFVYSSVKSLDPVIEFYRNNGFQTWAIQLFKEIG
jgi:GNAT superfamily N-acetyltransferase